MSWEVGGRGDGEEGGWRRGDVEERGDEAGDGDVWWRGEGMEVEEEAVMGVEAGGGGDDGWRRRSWRRRRRRGEWR